MNALLITQDPDETAIFSMTLQRAGMAVTVIRDLAQVVQTWSERPADLILAAVVDPPAQEQVRLIRAETLAPLILVIPRPDEALQCELLDLGADLVLVPPFSIRLLIAQVKVLLRRSGNVPAFSLPSLSVTGLTLHPGSRTVELAVSKSTQRLTQLEFRLLYTLLVNRGQIIPTETIVEHVWGYTGQGDRDLVRGLVSRLRLKIEANPKNPQFIQTAPGIGYIFKADEPPLSK